MSTIEIKPRDLVASKKYWRLPDDVQKEVSEVASCVDGALDEISFACRPDLSESGKPVIVGCVDTRRLLVYLLTARAALERLTGNSRKSTIHGWDWPELPKAMQPVAQEDK